MTYSNTNTDNANDDASSSQVVTTGSNEISTMLAMAGGEIIPPQAPNHYQTFTNPTTGGLYYYIKGGADVPGLNTRYKNSWVFVPHGKDFVSEPPYDPSLGNLWVDRNNSYITYVWNGGEAQYEHGWIALTTKKRAYDHFVLQLAETPSDLEPIIGNKNYMGGLAYSIYKQGYIYYNVNDLNLYVWNGPTDEWGVPLPHDNDSSWVSITQHELVPDPGVQSSFSQFKDELAQLEADVAKLKAEVSA